MKLEELIKLTRKLDDGLTTAISAANKPLDELASKLTPELVLDPSFLEEAVQSTIKKAALQSLRAALPEAAALAESFVSAASTAQSVTEKILSAERVAAETFLMAQTQRISIAARNQLAALTLRLGANLEDEIKKKLVGVVVGHAVKKAKTAVFTAVSGYQRGVQQAAYEPPSIDEDQGDLNVPRGRYFVYIGPDDRITRPFCGVLLGRAIPNHLVDSLRNAHNLPFRRFCGGFNCRHTLVPVSHRYVAARRLSVVDASDVARANAIARTRR